MHMDKYFSGMLNYNPNIEWIDQQTFTSDGQPIPIAEHALAINVAPKMMTPPNNFSHMTDNEIHEAAEAGQAWKTEFKRFLSASIDMQNNIKNLELKDKDKMQDLAVERAVIGQGMLNTQDRVRQFNGHPSEIVKTPPSEKPGYMMAEGTNFWVVNTEDPYWDTEEGYQEAIDLYGESPAWSSRPMERENNFVSFEPSQRISL